MPKKYDELNDWQKDMINKINAIAETACKTTSMRTLFNINGVRIIAKEEFKQETGSHKIRLVRSLLIHAVAEGWINEKTTVLVDESSGSTARAESYFVKKLRAEGVELQYYAVLPKDTADSKIEAIKDNGGGIIFKTPGTGKENASLFIQQHYEENQPDWHYIDQFENAAVAIDYDTNIGNINLAQELGQQIKSSNIKAKYIVCGAGTGGTATTIGKYLNSLKDENKPLLVVVDPEYSAFYLGFADHHKLPKPNYTPDASRIEGIGRPRLEKAFDPSLVKRMLQVPDAASIAALDYFNVNKNQQVGPSSGTCLYGAFHLANEMLRKNEKGDIVTFIFDSGDYYKNTYYNLAWRADAARQQHRNEPGVTKSPLNVFDFYTLNISLIGTGTVVEDTGVRSLSALNQGNSLQSQQNEIMRPAAAGIFRHSNLFVTLPEAKTFRSDPVDMTAPRPVLAERSTNTGQGISPTPNIRP